MNRPRREIVVPLKYRVEPEKPPENQPKKQPRKQPQKPVEASKSPAKTTTKTTNAPAKTKKTERRVLNLDLPDVPPSEYEKYVEDWSLPDNPYWKNNFHTPQDNTTQEYMEATEKLENLPASFVLRRDVETAFGVANLELNPNLIKPIKRIPLYSKLEKGEYETVGSKSDKTNIAGSIKFFKNNLASFVQFKATDDISWVIHQHRQLVTEILEFYGNKEKTSLATIKSRFNAITRIFRIAYETKNYELYVKYSSLVLFLSQEFEDNEFDNELSEEELKKFVTFDVVLNKQKELQKQFELIKNKNSTIAYDLNQDLVLISLYSLIPPLRQEVMTLKFSKKLERKDDWVVIKSDDVIMDLNEIKKKHPAIMFHLAKDAPELAKILRESYDLYPREFLFTHYKKYPDVSRQASPATLSTRLSMIFNYTGKKVGINSLRSSYVSFKNSEAIKNGKQLTVNQKDKIAEKMRSSRQCFDEAYLKIFPITQQDLRQKEPSEIVVRPVDEALPTERQNRRTKQYYYKNKEQVLKQQREYQDKKSPFEKSRIKMLYYLNSDTDYHTKMKPATQAKYNFKKEGNKWV
jgi:hypothetical protein